MRIISRSEDQTIRIWDAQSGTVENTLEGHISDVNSVAYSPDGMRFILGSADQTIHTRGMQSGLECTPVFAPIYLFRLDSTTAGRI